MLFIVTTKENVLIGRYFRVWNIEQVLTFSFMLNVFY